MLIKRRTILAAAGAAAVLPAWSQAGYPNRPVRIVVATVAGSGPDIAVRRLGTHLTEILKQPVVVDNRPGGNGVIAAQEVLRAPRDGYTLLNTNIGSALNDILRPGSGPRLNEELVPVSDVTYGALVMLVNASLPIRNAREFIDYAKANPNKLNYGSGGPGSLIQLTGERMKIANGIELKEVPYRSLGADIADLIAGHIQVGFTVWSVAEQHVKTGKLRAIAVASDRRMAVAPDLPTFAEAGLTPITATGWNGIFAGAGTPPEIVQTLGRAIATAVARPDFRDFFLKDGSDIGGKTPEQFATFIRQEQDRYKQVITQANIKVE